MDRAQITEKLFEIVCDFLELDADEITMESDLREDFDADSLDMVDIIMDIEDAFGVEVPDEVLDKLVTVKDVVDYIEENM
ncbi:MAG: acyl carrier protein [Oscillospiraceae bacterium]|nr:acyl carrier protein [Oscillospiraceae bacterium]